MNGIITIINNSLPCHMQPCECCGMPLEEGMTSRFDNRYCIFCQNQETGKLKTMEEVREGSIEAAIRLLGKTREEAEAMADHIMPQLPCWKKKNAFRS